MRKWPWTRDVRATAPAEPPAADRPSSRSAPEAAGWGRPTAGPTLSRPAAPAAVRRAQRRAGAPARRSHRRGPPAVVAPPRRLGPGRRRAEAAGRPDRRPLRGARPRFRGRSRRPRRRQGGPAGRGAGPARRRGRHRPGGGVRRHRCARGRAAVLRGAAAGALRRLSRPDLRRPRVRRLARRPRRLHDRLLRRPARRPRAHAGHRRPGLGPAGATPVLAAVADRHARAARRRPLVPRHGRPVLRPARARTAPSTPGRCGSCWSTPG